MHPLSTIPPIIMQIVHAIVHANKLQVWMPLKRKIDRHELLDAVVNDHEWSEWSEAVTLDVQAVDVTARSCSHGVRGDGRAWGGGKRTVGSCTVQQVLSIVPDLSVSWMLAHMDSVQAVPDAFIIWYLCFTSLIQTDFRQCFSVTDYVVLTPYVSS